MSLRDVVLQSQLVLSRLVHHLVQDEVLFPELGVGRLRFLPLVLPELRS